MLFTRTQFASLFRRTFLFLLAILGVSQTLGWANIPVERFKPQTSPVPHLPDLIEDVEYSMIQPLTMALKFVEFFRDDGNPILSEPHVKDLVDRMNRYFKSCTIRFQMEDYKALDSKSYGLSFKIESARDMKVFRKPFDDPRYLVVINTHSWDHQKMGTASAWTAMPGEVPSGTVLEAPVASYPGLLAHELGHYLSLSHVSNVKNLMNPIIYRTSTFFTPKQCMQMRKSAFEVRSSAIREGLTPLVSKN